MKNIYKNNAKLKAERKGNSEKLFYHEELEKSGLP